MKKVHEEDRDKSYLNWMLTNPKACKDLDEEHIVKKGLLHWKEQTPSAGTVKNPKKATARRDSATSDPEASRFKDSRGKDMWITGFDVIALFHMKENQLKSAGVKRKSNYALYNRQYRTHVYSLKEVYEAAVRTPNCPKDETPDQALERYFEKVKRCGDGAMSAMTEECACSACEDLRCGPTRGGTSFVMEIHVERLKERQKMQEIEDRRWHGIEPWMGDYD